MESSVARRDISIILIHGDTEHQQQVQHQIESERCGSVHLVPDPQRALEQYMELVRFDLAVIDMDMPDSGTPFIASVRKLDKHCPKMILATSEDARNATGALLAGANAFCPAPLSVGAFRKAVRDLFSIPGM